MKTLFLTALLLLPLGAQAQESDAGVEAMDAGELLAPAAGEPDAGAVSPLPDPLCVRKL